MTDCPCGSGQAYAECCGPLLDGTRLAATAVELMRSRYSAFVTDNRDHLFRTWHPRTRPQDVGPTDVIFEHLEILDTQAGRPDDQVGEVEFIAHFRTDTGTGRLHERSRFARRAGRWFYLDGAVSD